MSHEYSMIDILRILGKWKKHIIIATLSAAVLTAIVTLLMPNYYQATTSFYAINPKRLDPIPLRGEEAARDIFGNDDDTDRLFTIAKSHQTYDFLIDSFDLYNHYGIEKGSPKGVKKIYKKLHKLFNIVKTEYGAIELSVEDVDPQLSMTLTKAARNYVDREATMILKSALNNQIAAKRNSLQSKKSVLKSISDSLQNTRAKYGILDLKSQGEVYSQMSTEAVAQLEQEQSKLGILVKSNYNRDSISVVRARVEGLKKKVEKLNSQIGSFNDGFLQAKLLASQEENLSFEYNQDIERLTRLEDSYSTPFSAVKVIEEAVTPFEKSRPKRSIYVVGIALLAFILMSLLAIFLESAKDVKWKDVYAGK